MGGTHTHGNVRMVCRTCNLSRPKDSSDVVGQITLWAQAVDVVPTAPARQQLSPTARRRLATRWKGQAKQAEYEAEAALVPLALQLRQQQESWASIGEVLGYGPDRAWYAVKQHDPEGFARLPRFWAAGAKRKQARPRQSWSKAQERYDRMTSLRAGGKSWKEVAVACGYANARSARRCYRGDRQRVNA